MMLRVALVVGASLFFSSVALATPIDETDGSNGDEGVISGEIIPGHADDLITYTDDTSSDVQEVTVITGVFIPGNEDQLYYADEITGTVSGDCTPSDDAENTLYALLLWFDEVDTWLA